MMGAGEDVRWDTGLNTAIREHRRSLSLTQKEFAEKVGACFNTVLSWEKGRTKPTIDQLITMSRLFGVREQDLLYPAEATKEIVSMG